MLLISDIFVRLRQLPDLPAALTLPPPAGGAGLAVAYVGYETVRQAPAFVNVGAGFHLWWRARDRKVWRVKPATAASLREVGLSFLPELPPESWSGAATLIESADRVTPLVRDFVSILAYQCEDSSGAPRYFFVGVRAPDGVFAFGIRSDLGKLNAAMAKSGRLLDLAILADQDPDWASVPPERVQQTEALDIVRYVFAASYYALAPESAAVELTPGPPERNARGKVARAGGRPVPLWTYADLTITAKPAGDPGQARPLDTSGLDLAPVIVSPHVRRLEGGRVVIVDAHASHRWTRPGEATGKKVTI